MPDHYRSNLLCATSSATPLAAAHASTAALAAAAVALAAATLAAPDHLHKLVQLRKPGHMRRWWARL